MGIIKFFFSSRPNLLGLTLAQLSSPQFNSFPTSEDDTNLVNQVYGILSQGDIGDNYDKALQLIIHDFSKCTRKDRLCELLGNIYLNRKDPVSIGWYMQSCILGSSSWVPYLMVYYAAKQWLPTVPLSRRCVFASEILCTPDMKRMDDIEDQIVSVIKSPYCDYDALVTSMLTFEKNMNPYLPAHDKFSFYENERATYYMTNLGQFESDDFKLIKRKLLERR